MDNVKGKRLLVLGGTFASVNLVQIAKGMGIYTIVTDPNETGPAKEIADETAMVDTTDIDGLVALCRERKVDGIFSGPSEFNLRNVITASEKAGLPCYTTMEIWNRCANKDVFKSYCRQYGIDCTPEYSVDRTTPAEELDKLDYPVIVKPVDGNSSAGITVCFCTADMPAAMEKAYAASKSGRIIVEKYIQNNGEIFTATYALKDGEAYLFSVGETFVADPVNSKSLVNVYGHGSRKYKRYYIDNVSPKVCEMFRGMGMKNGIAFLQALPCDGKIYLHEMGYRLSGGMNYKITEPLIGINDMKIMIRQAVGGEPLTDEEIDLIKATRGRTFRISGQLKIILTTGTIGRIEGIEEARKYHTVQDVLMKHQVGDTIEPKMIGTLSQQLCNITIFADSVEEELQTIHDLQSMIKAYDTEGNLMNILAFDSARLD